MPPLGRENDAGGRFTDWPGPDSHGTHRICADATASYASAARPVVARRADEAEMGATPPVDALVMAWAGAGFHKPRTASGGVAPGPMIPGGKAIRVPPTGGLMGLASGSALTGRMRSTVVREAAPMPELVRAPTGRLDFGAAPRCMNSACSASQATLVPRGTILVYRHAWGALGGPIRAITDEEIAASRASLRRSRYSRRWEGCYWG